MAEAGETTTEIRPEVAERWKEERDQARAEAEQLKRTVADLGATDIARRWFSEQKADDPERWASIALPHIRELEPDAAREKMAEMFPSVPSAQSSEPPAEPPASETPPQPESGFGGPNPSAPSIQVGTQSLKMGTPEFRARVTELGGGRQALEQMRASGEWSGFSPETVQAYAELPDG